MDLLEQLKTARTVVEAAPLPAIFIAIALVAAGWWLGRLVSGEKEKSLNSRISGHGEEIKRKEGDLERQKIKLETEIEALKSDNGILKDQIAEGVTDLVKIEAARRDGWTEGAKALLQAIAHQPQTISYFPGTSEEARVSGNASFLVSSGAATAVIAKDGRHATLSATDHLTWPQAYFVRSEWRENDQSKKKPNPPAER